MALQHLRSSTANKRPIPTVMSAGQLAINTNEGSPGLFFKDSNGDLVKVGPVHIGTTAPNSSPDSVAATALVTGTVYQILTVGNSDFTLVGASANTVGTVFTATGTTTGTGTVSGQQGNEKGEQWLDTTGSAFDLKIYDGTAWRSQAGEFVNVTGDTMTGAFGVVAGTTSAPGVFFSGDTDTGIYSPVFNQFGISTAGTSRIVVDSSGNVEIGTSLPVTQRVVVDSSGKVMIGTNTSRANLTVAKGGSSIPAAGADTASAVFSNGIEDAVYGLIVGADSNGTGYLQAQRTDGNTTVYPLTIQPHGGNVGIGTNTPYRQLSVSSDTSNSASDSGVEIRSGISGQSSVFFTDPSHTDVGRIGYVHSDNHMFFRVDNSERMRIDSSGKVGIGLTPGGSSKLQVNGSMRFAGNGTASDSSNPIIYRVSGQDSLAFASGNSERMRISSSGMIGINEANPGHYIDMNIGSTDVGIKITSTDAGSYIQFADNSTTGETRIGALADSLKFDVNNSERMVITSDGKFGFNTTDPGAFDSGANNFVVQGNTSGTGNSGINIVSSSASYGNIYFGDGTGAASYRGFIAYNHNGDQLRFGANGTERMRITSSGKVGIGTFNPSEKFVVSNGGNEGFEVVPASASNLNVFYNYNRNTNAYIDARYLALSHQFWAGSSSSEAMRIDSSGRLLVGMSSFTGEASVVLEGSSAGGNTQAQLWLNRGQANPTTDNVLGQIIFGDATASGRSGAMIQARVDSSWGSNDYPSRLGFFTTADGASSPTERMRISNDGYFKAANDGDYQSNTSYHEFSQTLNEQGMIGVCHHASFTENMFIGRVKKNASNSYNFLILQSGYTNTFDSEFILRGDGQGYADGSWNGGGADYAEYFEWLDKNASNDDRRGIAVVLDGEKIREAVEGEDPIGVISGNPSVVGDTAWNHWQGKNLRDDFGTYIEEDYEVKDDDGNTVIQQRRKVNPDFDPDAKYVSREDRPEWGCVGLMGKLRIRKGQVTGSRWIKMRDISDSVEEWLVR